MYFSEQRVWLQFNVMSLFQWAVFNPLSDYILGSFACEKQVLDLLGLSIFVEHVRSQWMIFCAVIYSGDFY